MRAVHLLYSRRDQQHFVNVNMLRLLLTASLVVILSTSASCKSSHDSAAGGDCLVAHRKIGCFADKHGAAARVRPVTELLFSERRNAGPRHSNGFVIDWDNWDTYLPALACRCAQAAKRKGYKIFSLEFYGECWGGSDGYTFSMDGPSAKCVDEQEDPCDMVSSHACAGKADAMFVYYAP